LVRATRTRCRLPLRIAAKTGAFRDRIGEDEGERAVLPQVALG
jgi:hypothetical protein